MRVELFTREGCRYCEETKSLLIGKQIPFTEHKIETSKSLQELKRLFPGARTYPVIIIDDEWIGGYTQLQEYLNDVATPGSEV